MSQNDYCTAAITDAGRRPVFSDRRVLFVITFVAAILLSFMAGYFIPPSVDDLLRSATSYGAVLLANILGMSAFVEPGHIITIEGKRLSIVSECTAIGYLLIFAAAVIAYPSSGRKKLSGLFFGIPVLMALNLFRITMLGLVGGHYPAYFDLFHTWLWEGGFLVIVLLVWIGWVNSLSGAASAAALKDVKTDILKTGVQQRLFLLLSAGTALFFFSESYQNMIALSAEGLAHLMGYDGVLIRADGNFFVVAFSRHNFKEFWAGICYLVPFVVLMLLFPRIGRSGKEEVVPQRETIFKLISGFVVMTVIQIISVILFFILVKQGKSGWPLATVDTMARLSPAIVWLALANCWRSMRENPFH